MGWSVCLRSTNCERPVKRWDTAVSIYILSLVHQAPSHIHLCRQNLINQAIALADSYAILGGSERFSFILSHSILVSALILQRRNMGHLGPPSPSLSSEHLMEGLYQQESPAPLSFRHPNTWHSPSPALLLGLHGTTLAPCEPQPPQPLNFYSPYLNWWIRTSKGCENAFGHLSKGGSWMEGCGWNQSKNMWFVESNNNLIRLMCC